MSHSRRDSGATSQSRIPRIIKRKNPAYSPMRRASSFTTSHQPIYPSVARWQLLEAYIGDPRENGTLDE